MPREQINHPQTQRVTTGGLPVVDVDPALTGATPTQGSDGSIEYWTDPAVHVSWNAERVQLAFEADQHTFDNAAPSLTREGGRPVVYTGVLDRGDLNRLIAALRRARDAAYGKDQ